MLIALQAIVYFTYVDDSTCSTAFRSDRVVHINPVLHLLPFPHVWQNLDWSHPRSFKRRSIVVSSAWEGLFCHSSHGGGSFHPTYTLTPYFFHLCVCVFEVVMFVSWIEAENVNRDKFSCGTRRHHVAFYANVSHIHLFSVPVPTKHLHTSLWKSAFQELPCSFQLLAPLCPLPLIFTAVHVNPAVSYDATLVISQTEGPLIFRSLRGLTNQRGQTSPLESSRVLHVLSIFYEGH